MNLKHFNFFNQIRIYLGLVLVGLILVVLQRVGILNILVGGLQNLALPIQVSFSQTYRNLTSTLKTVKDIGNLRGHNSLLEKQNALLEAENSRLKVLEKENTSLRKQLNTPLSSLKVKLAASIIGISPLGTKNVLLIDKGETNGVQVGDLVLVQNILLGEIVLTSPKISSVKLLTDPDTKIPVVTANGSKGILEGQFGSGMNLNSVVQDDLLLPGDLVMTSGKDNFPKALLIGKINKVSKIDKEFFQKASISPLLNLKDLDLVYLVKGE